MDQSPHQDFVGNPMHACERGPVEPLLRTSRGRKLGESDVYEALGSDVYEEAIFWISPNDLVASGNGTSCESETGGEAHEKDGASGNGSWAPHESTEPQASGVSVFTPGIGGLQAGNGVVHGHHIHSASPRVHVSGGRDGLAQSLCFVLGAFEQPGNRFLFGRIGKGIRTGMPTDIQYRSGIPVHKFRVYRTTENSRNPDQHGRKRQGFGQCVRGAPLAHGQIRRRVSTGLRRRKGPQSGALPLFPVLQYGETSHSSELENSKARPFQLTLGASSTFGVGSSSKERSQRDTLH